MSSELLARMCRDWRGYSISGGDAAGRQAICVCWHAGDACRGVFGGQGGIYMIGEKLA